MSDHRRVIDRRPRTVHHGDEASFAADPAADLYAACDGADEQRYAELAVSRIAQITVQLTKPIVLKQQMISTLKAMRVQRRLC